MRRYPEYKESGMGWIGEIPKDWTISKVKHEFESLDNLRIPLNSETRGSMKLKVYDYYGASGIIDKVEDYIFDESLILIGEDGANLYLRSTPLSFKATGKYWVNNHAHVLRPKHGNIDYLVNMLESLDYTHYITGAAQPKLTSEHLMNITIIIPPLPEQTQIANFLDRKTGQIDELIRTKERRIELLQEQRTALINQTVKKGLDPNVEMKPSRLEWIGEIPKHWQVLRNFAIFSDRSDRGHPHLLPFSVTQRAGVIPQEYGSDQIVRASSRTENGKRICKGDLVYNKMRMWQGAVGVAPAEGRVSTAYVVCQPIRDLTPEFFEYLYRTPLYMAQSLRFSYGGCKDQYCLYSKDFKNIYTIFPPKQEQTQIVNFLDRETQQIDELISAERRKIELLKEYRQSLISEVVTGKIDVRNEV